MRDNTHTLFVSKPLEVFWLLQYQPIDFYLYAINRRNIFPRQCQICLGNNKKSQFYYSHVSYVCLYINIKILRKFINRLSVPYHRVWLVIFVYPFLRNNRLSYDKMNRTDEIVNAIWWILNEIETFWFEAMTFYTTNKIRHCHNAWFTTLILEIWFT